MTKEECARVIDAEVDLLITIRIKDNYQSTPERIADLDRLKRNYELAIMECLTDDFNQVEIVAMLLKAINQGPKPKLGQISMEVEK
jgi:hypothetical protein